MLWLLGAMYGEEIGRVGGSNGCCRCVTFILDEG